MCGVCLIIIFCFVCLLGGMFFVFVHVCMGGFFFLRRIKAVFSAGSTKVMLNFCLLPLKVNNKLSCAGET